MRRLLWTLFTYTIVAAGLIVVAYIFGVVILSFR